MGEFTFDREMIFTADGKNQSMANGIAVPGGYRFYTFSHGDAPAIYSFFTRDGIVWTADSGTRLSLDTSTGLESWGVKDLAVLRLSDGSYFMVYVTEIPELRKEKPPEGEKWVIKVNFTGSTYKIASGKTSGNFHTGQSADIMLSGIDFNNSGGALLFNRDP
ncbi:MAG: hypothetical protein ACUVQ5_00235 [Candidatus Methanomethylicaceae archaeon]